MKTKTIILMGPQGSGKGTQLTELKNYFDAHNELVSVFQTGEMFRTLQEKHSFVARKVKETLDAGTHQPLVLSVSLWGHVLVKYSDPHNHHIIDGFPRRLEEAQLLDEMLDFCERLPADVIYIDVNKEKTIQRMHARGRADDTAEAIEKRMAFFEACTTPIMSFYENHASYRVHHIDGAQPIDAVHTAIRAALNLSHDTA